MPPPEDPTNRPAHDVDAAPHRAQLAAYFQLIAELGRGSSGTVHRARLSQGYGPLAAGTEVAVKFLRQDLLSDERARARFTAEGVIGQHVRHKNVAAIHGIETLSLFGTEVTYLVMELVQGTTLRLRLGRQGPPVEDLTRRIGHDAALGLAALHERGLVHRDVKPENLLLTPDGEVKIVDLGLVRPFGSGQRPPSGELVHGSAGSSHSSGSGARGLAGSIAYTAPEVLRGSPTTPGSDLYSLGVVLYEVATGKHPFADAVDADQMLHSHLFTTPAPASHLRPRMTPLLDQLIAELLQKDPGARPGSAAEVAERLQQGESSSWWRDTERKEPALASARRLQRMRRSADTPFVGRERQLQRLDRRLQAARRGRGAVVCIRGPRGIGRRRLLDEAMTAWLDRHDNLLFLGGEADPELGHGEPFSSSVLDWLLRGASASAPGARERAESRARLELDFGEEAATAMISVAFGESGEDATVRASRLGNALLQLPRRGRTLVLRIDLADGLDTSGRLVLDRLVRECRRHEMLVLVTAGPDWQVPKDAERIDLQGLDEDDFLAFGKALLHDAQGHEEQLRQAHATFSGSPGNLIEALDHLVQTDRLLGRPGSYAGLDPDLSLRPAPGHLERFRRRVEELPAAPRRVLVAAAVLGMRSRLRDVTALSGSKELQVLETLSLFRGRILRAQSGEVSFRHRDFQQATLRSVAAAERREMHVAAARLLERRHATSLQVGMQLSQALDHRGSIPPLLDALGELVRSGSKRTGLRIAARLQVHLQQVRDVPEFDAARLRHLLLAGGARRNAGQPKAAATLFREADGLARRLGDPLGRGEALTNLARHTFEGGHLLQAIALLENAHAALADAVPTKAADRPATPPPGRTREDLAADASALHGRLLLYLGQSEPALAHLQTALRLLGDDTEREGHLRIDLARVQALRHHYPTAQKTLARVSGRRSRHLPQLRMRHHLYRGELLAQLGDEAAMADLREATVLAQRLAQPAFGARAMLLTGALLEQRGERDTALSTYQAAARSADRVDDRVGVAMARIELLRLGEPQDGLDEAVDALALPAVTVTHLLTVAGLQATTQMDRQRFLQQAEALAASVDLPLPVHLRLLWMTGMENTAHAIVQDIAQRMTDRKQRRQFVRLWQTPPTH
jgi:serine/threonine protein kinase/tetratricopeptide (TPR) repeat protein